MATAFGIYLTLIPAAAVVAVPLFALAAGLSGFVSVGSLLAGSAMPFLAWFISHSRAYTGLAVIVAAFIWIKHRDNIRRLLAGNEKSFRRR